MRQKLPWAAFAILLVIVGCASIQPVPDPVIEATDSDSVGEDTSAETVPVVEGRPQAPAPLDSYRVDSPELIGMTGNPQLVEFFAFWCTTCRFMRPTVHQLEADYWGELDFVYLDIDSPDNNNAKQEYAFVAQPLFVLLDADGNEIQRWFGVVSEDEFRAAFDAATSG